MIGVFGAEMELMQIHFTLMLVVCIIIITAQVRPFGTARTPRTININNQLHGKQEGLELLLRERRKHK